jgi:hypothetical protein
MKAEARSFTFLGNEGVVKIPFFQRAYVWDETNWSDLIDDLLDFSKNHFLGSLILKQQKTRTGQAKEVLVIDGQQRLTTISILIKSIFDSFPEEIKANSRTAIYTYLFYKMNQTDNEKYIKIEHSHIDAEYYKTVIETRLDKQSLDGINDESNKILRCYKYFIKKLKDIDITKRIELFNKILNQENKILVLIDLEDNEDEQAIFDTINSAGVRLTGADIVKNALFQKALELNGSAEQESIIRLYKTNWENIFAADEETKKFWETSRLTGRLMRDNIEILLHCIAIIKGFFDPDMHTLSNLSELYKNKINSFTDLSNLKLFIEEMSEYARLYREGILSFDDSTIYSFSNDVQRLFHILSIMEISTFHPFILHLLKKYGNNEAVLLTNLKKLESLVMRRMIAKQETKSYNKLCKEFINNETYLDEKLNQLSNEMVRNGLKSINNKNASLVLFWIELYRRINDPRYDEKDLKYNYSLEHIMPQKWEEYWCSMPAKYDLDGTIMSAEEAKKDRNDKIYYIGNMTLLKTSLNTSLRNYTFDRKIEGDGRKKGMRTYATLSITNDDIISPYNSGDTTWDETKIIDRTEKLATEILNLW